MNTHVWTLLAGICYHKGIAITRMRIYNYRKIKQKIHKKFTVPYLAISSDGLVNMLATSIRGYHDVRNGSLFYTNSALSVEL